MAMWRWATKAGAATAALVFSVPHRAAALVEVDNSGQATQSSSYMECGSEEFLCSCLVNCMAKLPEGPFASVESSSCSEPNALQQVEKMHHFANAVANASAICTFGTCVADCGRKIECQTESKISCLALVEPLSPSVCNATCRSSDLPEYSILDGYISSGEAISSEVMTVDAAKARCASMPECEGFSFEGPAAPENREPVMVRFWSTLDLRAEVGWITYSRDDLEGAAEQLSFSSGSAVAVAFSLVFIIVMVFVILLGRHCGPRVLQTVCKAAFGPQESQTLAAPPLALVPDSKV